MTSSAIRRLLVSAVVSAAAMAVAMTGPAAHADAPSSNLACQGTATLNYSPPFTNAQRVTTVTGTALLDDCYSADGTNADILSGKVTISASGGAGCTQTGVETGTAIFTWYSGGHQAGNAIGNTTVPFTLSEHPDFADNLIANEWTGSVSGDSSRVVLDGAVGSFEPTSVTGTCTNGGVAKVTADMAVNFTPAL
jgi:hypothetical protein